jgi:hypothetical protein
VSSCCCLKALHCGQLHPFLKNHLKSLLGLVVLTAEVLEGVAVFAVIVCSVVAEESFAKEERVEMRLVNKKMKRSIRKRLFLSLRISRTNVLNFAVPHLSTFRKC